MAAGHLLESVAGHGANALAVHQHVDDGIALVGSDGEGTVGVHGNPHGASGADGSALTSSGYNVVLHHTGAIVAQAILGDLEGVERLIHLSLGGVLVQEHVSGVAEGSAEGQPAAVGIAGIGQLGTAVVQGIQLGLVGNGQAIDGGVERLIGRQLGRIVTALQSSIKLSQRILEGLPALLGVAALLVVLVLVVERLEEGVVHGHFSGLQYDGLAAGGHSGVHGRGIIALSGNGQHVLADRQRHGGKAAVAAGHGAGDHIAGAGDLLLGNGDQGACHRLLGAVEHLAADGGGILDSLVSGDDGQVVDDERSVSVAAHVDAHIAGLGGGSGHDFLVHQLDAVHPQGDLVVRQSDLDVSGNAHIQAGTLEGVGPQVAVTEVLPAPAIGAVESTDENTAVHIIAAQGHAETGAGSQRSHVHLHGAVLHADGLIHHAVALAALEGHLQGLAAVVVHGLDDLVGAAARIASQRLDHGHIAAVEGVDIALTGLGGKGHILLVGLTGGEGAGIHGDDIVTLGGHLDLVGLGGQPVELIAALGVGHAGGTGGLVAAVLQHHGGAGHGIALAVGHNTGQLGHQTGQVDHGLLQLVGGLGHLSLSGLGIVQNGLGLGQSGLEGSPIAGVVALEHSAALGDQLAQVALAHLADGDAQVIQDEVLVAAEVGRSTAGTLSISALSGGADAEPGLAGLVANDCEGAGGSLTQRHLQGDGGGGAVAVLAAAVDHLIGASGTHLILEGHIVGHAGLKVEVLGDGVVDGVVVADQAVDLHRPVAIQYVIHLLHVPARLSVGGVELGEVIPAVGNALGAGHDEGEQALSLVLEVLIEGDDVALLVIGVQVGVVGHHANVVEVGVALARLAAQSQGVGLPLLGREEHIHVLEVAAAALSGVAVVVDVAADVVPGDGAQGVVGSHHVAVVVGNGEQRLGVAAVVHAHIDSVGLTDGQVGNHLADSGLAAHLEHGGQVGGNSPLGSAGDSPAVGQHAVEGHVGQVHAVGGVGDLRSGSALLTLDHHVGHAGLGGEGNLAILHFHHGLVGTALVGQLIDHHVGQIGPAIGQIPSAVAVNQVVVIELLVLSGDSIAVLIPVPGDQVLQVAGGGVAGEVAGIGSAAENLLAVEGDGAGAVLQLVLRGVIGIGVVDGAVGTAGNHHGVVPVLTLEGDLDLGGPLRTLVLIEAAGAGAIGDGDGLVVVHPLHDVVMLEELGGQHLVVQVVDEELILHIALPALKALHHGAAQQGGVGGAAVGGEVGREGILIAVEHEAHDLAVELALLVVAAVGKVGDPVLEGGIPLVGIAPLMDNPPLVAGDLVGELAGLPGVLGAGGVVAPHVHVDVVQVVPNQLIELVETLVPVAGGQVIDAVDANALIQPVPAVAEQLAVALDHILAEGVRLRIELAGVDVDTELSAVLVALDQHGEHVLHAADALADVVVVGMAGVVALIGVALEEHGLTQAVGVEGHPLDVVKSGEEGVGRLTLEVHGDTGGDQITHAVAVSGDVDDLLVAGGDGAILPVHHVVVVLVAGDDHLHVGHLVNALTDAHYLLLIGQVGIGGLSGVAAADLAVKIPQGAAHAHGLVSAAVLSGDSQAVVVGTSRAAAGVGVAGDTGAQLAVGHESVHIALVVQTVHVQIAVHSDEGVAALDGAAAQTGGGQLGVGLVAADRNQAVVGELDALNRVVDLVGGLAVGQTGDVEGQGVVLRHHLGGDDRVDAVGLVLEGHGVGDLAAVHLRGHSGLHGHAVDLHGVQGGNLAVEGLAVIGALHVVLDNTGEGGVHHNVHGVGAQGGGGNLQLGQGHAHTGHVAISDGHFLSGVLIAVGGDGQRVFTGSKALKGEFAAGVGHSLLAVEGDHRVLHCAVLIADSAADGVAIHLDLAGVVDIADIVVGGGAAPCAGLEAHTAHIGLVHHDAGEVQGHLSKQVLTVYRSLGEGAAGPLQAQGGLGTGSGGGHAGALIPGVSGCAVLLPEPAAGICADKERLTGVLIVQIDAETAVIRGLSGFKGDLQESSAVSTHALQRSGHGLVNKDCRVLIRIGITVAVGLVRLQVALAVFNLADSAASLDGSLVLRPHIVDGAVGHAHIGVLRLGHLIGDHEVVDLSLMLILRRQAGIFVGTVGKGEHQGMLSILQAGHLVDQLLIAIISIAVEVHIDRLSVIHDGGHDGTVECLLAVHGNAGTGEGHCHSGINIVSEVSSCAGFVVIGPSTPVSFRPDNRLVRVLNALVSPFQSQIYL
ncbi:Uncharacterised protein [uncultured Flavonifractor sp.]|nr:Uncharacterised protein [uncultured Flavonifractor sp.]